MLKTAEYLLTASLVFVIVAFITNLIVMTSGPKVVRRTPAKKLATVGAAGDDDLEDDIPVAEDDDHDAELAELDDEVPVAPAKATPKSALNIGLFATGFTIMAWVLLTAYLGMRIVLTGHGPFSNMHEFAVSFVWGILAAYLVAFWRFKVRMLSIPVLVVSGGLQVYALVWAGGTDVEPLVPALQNNLLLTLHVGFAVLSYGAACVSFGAALLWLIYPHLKMKTPRDKLDEIGYKGAVVAFPLMTIMILLGALWANTAWGRPWGWDPKETAALVTWLVYAGFLHARVSRGWRGKRAAWMLVIGFAAVMFAYFGNYFFGGLHSYG